ncbi:MAG: hypothetical protein WBX15_12155 [Thermoanaerobaculia bacterium]
MIRPRIAIAAVAVLLASCATGTHSTEDPRLDVAASMRTSTRRESTDFLYLVRVRNVSGHMLFIRRVDVEPIGGGQIRPAFATWSKQVEPGEEIALSIWAELDPKETAMGVGDQLAKIIVSFDDGAEKILGTYLVHLK